MIQYVKTRCVVCLEPRSIRLLVLEYVHVNDLPVCPVCNGTEFEVTETIRIGGNKNEDSTVNA